MIPRLVVAPAVVLAALAALPSAAAPVDPLKLPGTPARPAAATAAAPVAASAEGSGAGASPASAPVAKAPAPQPPAPLTEAQKYCQNVAAAAADARFAWQSKKLGELQGQIQQRVGELEAKKAEVKAVLDRYDDAMRRAKANLVDIYAAMRPETAATQISLLDDAAAAAVLAQLPAKKASLILNEIAPERAVKIVNTLTSLVPPQPEKKT